jgi:hypothetical protein
MINVQLVTSTVYETQELREQISLNLSTKQTERRHPNRNAYVTRLRFKMAALGIL